MPVVIWYNNSRMSEKEPLFLKILVALKVPVDVPTSLLASTARLVVPVKSQPPTIPKPALAFLPQLHPSPAKISEFMIGTGHSYRQPI